MLFINILKKPFSNTSCKIAFIELIFNGVILDLSSFVLLIIMEIPDGSFQDIILINYFTLTED